MTAVIRVSGIVISSSHILTLTLRGSSDKVLWAKAAEEKRIIITRDREAIKNVSLENIKNKMAVIEQGRIRISRLPQKK